MTHTLNMLVLRPSGTIAVWTHDDVDNGWAYTAAEARAVASRCDGVVAQGEALSTVLLVELERGPVYFEGEAGVIAQIGANLRTLADVSDSVTATKQ